MLTRSFAAIPLLILAACSGPDVRVTPAGAAPPSAPEDRVSIRYGSVEVALVTMPSYAAGEDIFQQGADGTLLPLGPLWPDDPARATTLQIARDLGLITGRLVAPDPWPFRDFPDVAVDVRIEDYYTTAAGAFRLSGQYFVAPEEAGTNHAHGFAIEVPVDAPAGPAHIAAARSRAISMLALEIAENGLR